MHLSPTAAAMLGFLRRPPLLRRFLSSAALVVGTLRRHGIPDDLCSSVVSRFPRILTLQVDKNLAPKLAFLRSEGFSGHDLARILFRKPRILLQSLNRVLAPRVALLKSDHTTMDDVLTGLLSNHGIVFSSEFCNTNLLRDRGVPELIIYKLEESHGQPLCCPQWDLLGRVEFVIEKLGISPAAAAFSTALRALHGMSRPAIRRKVKLYEKLGWAEEEVLRMFRLQPATMRLSEGVVRKKVGYLRDALGLELLRRYPEIMTMSVEKRIAPRRAVLDLLMSRGLLGRTTRRPVRELKISDARFVEEFVEKHEEAAPDVVSAYYGREEAELSLLKEDADPLL